MGDYERKTRELRLEHLQRETHDAIQRHLDQYNLGPILDDYIMCVETVSTKKKKGLFKGPGAKQITSTAILTPTWLLYEVMDDKGIVSVLSVKLEDAMVEDHILSPFYEKLPDRGYHVKGIFTGQVGMHGRQHVSIFLGLGEERAAAVFSEALEDAIAKTRR